MYISFLIYLIKRRNEGMNNFEKDIEMYVFKKYFYLGTRTGLKKEI